MLSTVELETLVDRSTEKLRFLFQKGFVVYKLHCNVG